MKIVKLGFGARCFTMPVLDCSSVL